MKVKKIFSADSKKRLNTKVMAFFFQQLAIMTKSGITLVQAWKLILGEINDPKMRARLSWTAEQMENGISPATAMEESDLFPVLACKLIKAGEDAGAIDHMLSLLGGFYEKSARDKQNIINVLVYPIFLLGCTLLVLLGAMFYFLPIFEEMFSTMSIALPKPTLFLLHFQHIVRGHWCLIVASVLFFFVTLETLLKSKENQLALELIVLKNQYLHYYAIAWCWQRFAHILAVQLAGGIPILQAISDANAVISLVWFQERMKAVSVSIAEGVSFSSAIKQSQCGTDYIVTMLEVGESTGDYEEILQHISDYYSWHLSVLSKRVRRLLEPTVLLFAGSVIGLIVLCLVLPLFDVASSMAVKI